VQPRTTVFSRAQRGSNLIDSDQTQNSILFWTQIVYNIVL